MTVKCMSLKYEVLNKSIRDSPQKPNGYGFFLRWGHTAINFYTFLFTNGNKKKTLISEYLFFHCI